MHVLGYLVNGLLKWLARYLYRGFSGRVVITGPGM